MSKKIYQQYLKNIAIAMGCFLLVVILNFLLPRLLPGDTVAYLTGNSEEGLTATQYQAYYEALHLNESLLKQFMYYIGDIVKGSLGYSYRHNDTVAHLINSHMGITLVITLPALLLSSLIGLALGLRSGYHKGEPLDHHQTFFQTLLSTLPSFLIAFILLIIALKVGLPTSGLHSIGINNLGDTFIHLLLPILTLVISITPSRYLLVRNMAAKEMDKPYSRYARYRGLAPLTIEYKYIFPHIVGPFIQMVGVSMGIMLGGSVIIETIFSLNGMGRLLAQAINTLDYPLLQGILFMSSLIMLIAVIFTDLLCLILDPRLRGNHHA